MNPATRAAFPRRVVPVSVLVYSRNSGTDEGYIIATIIAPHIAR